MKNCYIEILTADLDRVLWHYVVSAETEEAAEKACAKKFIEEQQDNLLLDTHGLFSITVREAE